MKIRRYCWKAEYRFLYLNQLNSNKERDTQAEVEALFAGF